MKFHNIYFAKHPEDPTGKVYLFQAPLDKTIEAGKKYGVVCKCGERIVTAVTRNMMLPVQYAYQIMKVFGATTLAPTIGEVAEKTVKVMEPWEDNKKK